MDVREKLIGLVKNALRAYGRDLEKVVEPYDFIADFLIHSGVTVQEWVSVTERLPGNEDFVLVITSGKAGNIELVNAIELASFSMSEGWILEMWPEWEDPKITHWMPLPEPPKGE